MVTKLILLAKEELILRADYSLSHRVMQQRFYYGAISRSLSGWTSPSEKFAEITMKRQHTLFTFLSRRKRRAKTLKIKTLINRERESWGGLFYDECDRAIAVASGDWLWSDIVFLGHDPAVFWNAEIITTNFAFSDAVEEAAFNEAMLRLEAAGEQRVEPFDYSHRTTIGHILTPRAEQTYSIFNGLTFNDFIAKRAQEIARDAPPAVYCGYCILPGFTFGIGLGVIVEADLLSQTLIEATIQDFLAHCERNGVSEVPSPVPLYG